MAKNIAEKISPFEQLTLKSLLLRDLMKFQIFFKKTEYEGVTNMQIQFIPSTNADGKKN